MQDLTDRENVLGWLLELQSYLRAVSSDSRLPTRTIFRPGELQCGCEGCIRATSRMLGAMWRVINGPRLAVAK